YFVVETATAQYLTRNGHFTRSADGYLVTSEGDRVLGENGPLRIDGQVEISGDGSVRVDNQVVDRMLVVLPAAQNSLIKEGDSRFLLTGGWTRVQTPLVNQGEVENSNVNPIEEMTKMIAVTRAYESNQKAIAVMDEVMNKIANELGRV
ncbi:MAG TPA: flagellar basal-body rod protein FlgF, partial [Firmicutes bacterium]|nr:flagellar basal-body rod protein FlgF [Bacillota bacterium]